MTPNAERVGDGVVQPYMGQLADHPDHPFLIPTKSPM